MPVDGALLAAAAWNAGFSLLSVDSFAEFDGIFDAWDWGYSATRATDADRAVI
jgi:hypothetical protein